MKEQQDEHQWWGYWYNPPQGTSSKSQEGQSGTGGPAGVDEDVRQDQSQDHQGEQGEEDNCRKDCQELACTQMSPS